MSKQDKNKSRKLVCSKCLVTTNHFIVYFVKESWGNFDIQGEDTYEIVRCMGCDAYSFVHGSTNDSDVDGNPDTGEWWCVETVKSYPNRVQGLKKISDSYLLPVQIRGIYNETHEALRSQSIRLAAVGIRIIVDLTCRHLEADGSNLEKKINNLVEKGKITKDNADVLHETRLFGNTSAHELDLMSAETKLGIAVTIVEALLMNVFIIPEKAKELNIKKAH